MTEEEAKTKLCPAAMGHDQNQFNQKGLCFGSGCMAWRWNVVDSSADINEPQPLMRYGGYCGLSGKP